MRSCRFRTRGSPSHPRASRQRSAATNTHATDRQSACARKTAGVNGAGARCQSSTIIIAYWQARGFRLLAAEARVARREIVHLAVTAPPVARAATVPSSASKAVAVTGRRASSVALEALVPRCEVVDSALGARPVTWASALWHMAAEAATRRTVATVSCYHTHESAPHIRPERLATRLNWR